MSSEHHTTENYIDPDQQARVILDQAQELNPELVATFIIDQCGMIPDDDITGVVEELHSITSQRTIQRQPSNVSPIDARIFSITDAIQRFNPQAEKPENMSPEFQALTERHYRLYTEERYEKYFQNLLLSYGHIKNLTDLWGSIPEAQIQPTDEEVIATLTRLTQINIRLIQERKLQEECDTYSNALIPKPLPNHIRIQGTWELGQRMEVYHRNIAMLESQRSPVLQAQTEDISTVISVHPNTIAKALKIKLNEDRELKADYCIAALLESKKIAQEMEAYLRQTSESKPSENQEFRKWADSLSIWQVGSTINAYRNFRILKNLLWNPSELYIEQSVDTKPLDKAIELAVLTIAFGEKIQPNSTSQEIG